jgi:hypothetical protein
MKTFRFTVVYENPETSEVAEEYLTLAEALTHTPKPKAEIITNGTILAAAVGGVWGLTSAGSSWEEFPEASRPKLVNGCWVFAG